MTQEKIVEWYRRVGGRADALAAAKRVREEVDELIESLEGGAMANMDNARSEVADVGLCLLVTAEIMGCDLDVEMELKHHANLNRRWRVTEDGALYHVKEGQS